MPPAKARRKTSKSTFYFTNYNLQTTNASEITSSPSIISVWTTPFWCKCLAVGDDSRFRFSFEFFTFFSFAERGNGSNFCCLWSDLSFFSLLFFEVDRSGSLGHISTSVGGTGSSHKASVGQKSSGKTHSSVSIQVLLPVLKTASGLPILMSRYIFNGTRILHPFLCG